MRNNSHIVLLILFIAAGVFPVQARSVVNLAAGIVGSVIDLLRGQGVNIDTQTVGMFTSIAVIIITILALAAAIQSSGRAIKNRRRS